MFLRAALYLMRTYFRVEVVGLENIPLKGRVLVAPNHSGFAGLDALLLASIIKRNTKRRARLLAHRAYFDLSKKIASLAESLGLRRASLEEAKGVLENDHMLVLFPEGEAGNFKSSLKRYRLAPFKSGLLRLASQTQAAIVPCLIVGAEESNLNLGNLNLSSVIPGLRIPLPINWVALPAKWKIVFLKPILIGTDLEKSQIKKQTEVLRKRMQAELTELVGSRPYVYSRRAKRVIRSVQKKVPLPLGKR